MEITTRLQAAAKGLNKYFTGEPCVNGHVDYRYTSSGACKSCITKKSKSDVAGDPVVLAAKMKLAEAQAEHAAAVQAALRRMAEEKHTSRAGMDAILRKGARTQLVKVKVRAYDTDRDALVASAYAFSVARYPQLQICDIDQNYVPKDRCSGTAIYTFNVHPEDAGALKDVANYLLGQHEVDFSSVRRSILGVAADGLPVPSDFRVKTKRVA